MSLKLPKTLETHNLYALLGLENFSGPKELKRAFCRIALKHHPDRLADSKKYPHQFILAAQAYKILRDETLRKEYNKTLFQKNANGARFKSAEFLRQRRKSHKRVYSQRTHTDHDYSRFVTECRENFYQFLKNPQKAKVSPKFYNETDMKSGEFEDFVESCRDGFQDFINSVPRVKKEIR